MPLTLTFKKHPILSKLPLQLEKNQPPNFGLNPNSLKTSNIKGLYIIDEKALEEIFFNRCLKNDPASVQTLLKFDYTSLIKLDTTHPFHLAKNPFEKSDLVFEAISQTNALRKKDISLYLLEHLKQDLIKIINSQNTLLHEAVLIALRTVAFYRPEIAFKRLKQELGDNYTLNKKILNDENYETLLDVLEAMATEPPYFNFCVKHLFSIAIQEVKLGVYHGNYKAIHRLKSLFVSACAGTTVNLKDRKDLLDNLLNSAEKNNDYYELYVLMQIFGTAANIFDSGEYEPIEDAYQESYIHFAVDSLLRFAGINDDDGLCLTAEKELYEILECTINEPDVEYATEIPFRILKFFLETKKEWNIDPFHHLSHLEQSINDLKNEREDKQDDEHIQKLELRLQQLISLIADREFLSNDFTLYLSSKNENKMCEIGIEKDSQSQLELHARQSLAERLIFSGKTNIHDIARDWPKTTYIIANFGLVISDRSHIKSGNHKRIFKTIPIKLYKNSITGREHQNGEHAEKALFDYLLKKNNAETILTEFKNQFGINTKDHKVYAVILDLHGTYDMCLSCSKHSLDFQDQFRKQLLEIFKNHELKTLTKYPHQLPIVIRYSSDLRYHYNTTTDDKKKGILTLIQNEGAQRDLSLNEVQTVGKKDLKYFGANLLIHGKHNWHSFWSKNKRDEYTDKQIRLESWTAFTTDTQNAMLPQEMKQTNYTRLGMVETEKLKM